MAIERLILNGLEWDVSDVELVQYITDGPTIELRFTVTPINWRLYRTAFWAETEGSVISGRARGTRFRGQPAGYAVTAARGDRIRVELIIANAEWQIPATDTGIDDGVMQVGRVGQPPISWVGRDVSVEIRCGLDSLLEQKRFDASIYCRSRQRFFEWLTADAGSRRTFQWGLLVLLGQLVIPRQPAYIDDPAGQAYLFELRECDEGSAQLPPGGRRLADMRPGDMLRITWRDSQLLERPSGPRGASVDYSDPYGLPAWATRATGIRRRIVTPAPIQRKRRTYDFEP